jgi:hypothetical protein
VALIPTTKGVHPDQVAHQQLVEHLGTRAGRYPLLGLDRFLQSFRPALQCLDPAPGLADQPRPAALDHVVHIPDQQRLGVQRDVHSAQHLVVRAEQVDPRVPGLDRLQSVLGQVHGAPVVVDQIVGALGQGRSESGDLPVPAFDRIGLAGQHQRDPCFVQQDGVGLVEDGRVRADPDQLRRIPAKPVPQDVESGLGDRHVHHVGPVDLSPRLVRRPRGDEPDRHPGRLQQWPHPVGVPLRQVVVGRQHLDVPARAGEPDGDERADQGLPLACRQLDRDSSQHGCHSLQLDVERPQSHTTFGELSGDCQEHRERPVISYESAGQIVQPGHEPFVGHGYVLIGCAGRVRDDGGKAGQVRRSRLVPDPRPGPIPDGRHAPTSPHRPSRCSAD